MEDLLRNCAVAFNNLINLEYDIILGRKGKRYDVKLIFRPEDFHHLAGLQYLDDIKKVQINRERAFKDILLNKTTYDDIKNSPYLH